MYKSEIFNRMLTRAETGLYFVEDFLRTHSAKDAAYFRSICILISYSSELILKAALIGSLQVSSKTELETEMKELNHNVLRIAKKLGRDKQAAIGIKAITARQNSNFVGYVVETLTNKKLVIEDFIDIRYDFMKESLRSLPEHEVVVDTVEELIEISKRVRKNSAVADKLTLRR